MIGIYDKRKEINNLLFFHEYFQIFDTYNKFMWYMQPLNHQYEVQS